VRHVQEPTPKRKEKDRQPGKEAPPKGTRILVCGEGKQRPGPIVPPTGPLVGREGEAQDQIGGEDDAANDAGAERNLKPRGPGSDESHGGEQISQS
jgi:hypothetical protein